MPLNDYLSWRKTGQIDSNESKESEDISWSDSPAENINIRPQVKSVSEQNWGGDYGDDDYTPPTRTDYGLGYPDTPTPKLVKKGEKKKKAEGEDGEPKEPKPRKVFKVGDVLVMTNVKQKKLPNDAYEFLTTYGKFTVKEVNENGSLYLGYDRISDETHVMEKYWFSPNRFDLKTDKEPEEAEDNWWLK